MHKYIKYQVGTRQNRLKLRQIVLILLRDRSRDGARHPGEHHSLLGSRWLPTPRGTR